MSVKCQICYGTARKILSLGYLPPPNDMPVIHSHVAEPQTWFPTELYYCDECEMVQLGYVPTREQAFPDDYPYTSGATPVLRRNFEDLSGKTSPSLKSGDLIVDIGANDGTLLSCFPSYFRRLGVEPTRTAALAMAQGIDTVKAFFTADIARGIVETNGKARLVTCTNCFAHMDNIHDVIEGVRELLTDDGIFITESHYLLDLINKLQWDTIYAEHLRYYSVRSLAKLLGTHRMGVFKVERIPTHGGSIRVYAHKRMDQQLDVNVQGEVASDTLQHLEHFAEMTQMAKLALLGHLANIKSYGGQVVGFGAPSRASTVISYCGLDSSIVDWIGEQAHSHKIGRFMPGTDIPVVNEARIYTDQPDAVILFSWHLADELIPKMRERGYHGQIILPCTCTIVNEPAELVS